MTALNDSSLSPRTPLAGRTHRNALLLTACVFLSAAVGGFVGVELRITEGVAGATAWLLLLLGGAGATTLLRRWRASRAAWPLLLAFAFFVGLMLALALVRWLGFYVTGNTIMTVFSSAGAVLLAAAGLASLLKLTLTPMLLVALTLGVLGLVFVAADYLVRSSTPLLALSVGLGGALSALLLHRLRAQAYAPMGPAAATVHAFLDLLGACDSLAALFVRGGASGR
ncbi:MAG: hypothetical protein MUF76_13765 [Hydrogenophaga sp.]|nr:hypothetical protein [Hydrogenophaga sp.]